MAISFQNHDTHPFRLSEKTRKKNWLLKVIKAEKKRCGEIGFLFAGDEYVLEQNQHYLKHNFYTDIITFHHNEGDLLNGDILISTERVKENAKTFNKAFEEELLRVMVHGVLHLCGYGDKSKAEQLKMRSREDHYIRLYHSSVSIARK